jgi:hypothetical protein
MVGVFGFARDARSLGVFAALRRNASAVFMSFESFWRFTVSAFLASATRFFSAIRAR